MKTLEGKIAVVTGGARDIGRAVSIALADAGAAVAINYFDNPEDANETLAIIENAGGKAFIQQGDMTKYADAQLLMKNAAEKFGANIDILVNVAGGLVGRKLVADMEESFWNFVVTLNLTSVFLATKAALAFMNDAGSIVNFTSQAARDGGGFGASAYATAKGGVLTFTRSMAKELGARKIRVNAVSPGMINTTFHNVHTKPEIRQKVAASTPLGREGEAPEVAALVLFLAGPQSSFITGAAVEINGGTYFI